MHSHCSPSVNSLTSLCLHILIYIIMMLILVPTSECYCDDEIIDAHKSRTNVKYSINVSLTNSDSASPIIPLQLTHRALSLTLPVCKLHVPSYQSRFLLLVHTLLCGSPGVFKLFTWAVFGPVPSRSKFLKKYTFSTLIHLKCLSQRKD